MLWTQVRSKIRGIVLGSLLWILRTADRVHLRIRDRDMVEQGLARHARVALWIVEWYAALVSPEHVYLLPRHLLARIPIRQWWLRQQLVRALRRVPSREGNSEPGAFGFPSALAHCPRCLLDKELRRSLTHRFIVVVDTDHPSSLPEPAPSSPQPSSAAAPACAVGWNQLRPSCPISASASSGPQLPAA